jgi:formylglycine-generating enzyme required for sulfatase activity
VNDFRKARALVVGVESYAAGPEWNLKGPASDALDFTDWLLAMGMPLANVLLFVNSVVPGQIDNWRQGSMMHVNEPTSNAVYDTLIEVIGLRGCDALIIFWGGHGITDPEGRLRLFTSDASDEMLHNIDIDNLMMTLRSSATSPIDQQILIIDACRRYVRHRELRRGLPSRLFPVGELIQRDQFTLCATREGELAMNISTGTGRLSSVLLRELPTTPGILPNMDAVARRVRTQFERLRLAGDVAQVPVFYSSRGYDGSVHSENLVPYHTLAPPRPAVNERQYIQRLTHRLEAGLVGELSVNGVGPSFNSLALSSVITRAQVRSTSISAQHLRVPDVVDYMRHNAARRMIVCGAPGMGKTVLLHLLALEQCRHHRDGKSAIPVMMSEQSVPVSDSNDIEMILRAEAGFLNGAPLSDILHRCVFYLDAFDEITPHYQAAILEFMRNHPSTSVILSTRSTRGSEWSIPNCAEVELLPPNPAEVHQYLQRELGPNAGEEVFGQLVGRDYVSVRDSWRAAGGVDDELWSPTAPVPRKIPDEIAKLRLKLLRDPPAALQLSQVPFLLRAMVTILRSGEYLDLSRQDLLQRLIETLWSRLHAEVGFREIPLSTLFSALSRFAVQLVDPRDEDSEHFSRDALTESELLTDDLKDAAVRAGILDQGDPGVIFRHRVIRDFFAASAMSKLIPGDLSVDHYVDVNSWWIETVWSPVLALVPGFHGSLDPLVEWLGRAQPEIAATCIRENANLPDAAARQAIRSIVKEQLDEPSVRPPAELAALGRALDIVGDDRPGVGVTHALMTSVPDIDWVFIPKQEVPVSGVGAVEVPAFYMSRYAVTNAQYETFLRDNGYRHDRYWTNRGRTLRERLGWLAPERYGSPLDFPNHPRVGISFHEAEAFCNWLGMLRGEEIALPTVAQWMAGARSADGFDDYPWGSVFSSARCNSRQANVRTTTAVGVFRSGESLFGLADCGGNVWELCAPDRERWLASWVKRFSKEPDGHRYLPIKGGSFAHYWCSVKTQTNVTVREVDREWDVGFRLAKRL